MSDTPHAPVYAGLDPDTILQAVEARGHVTSGHLLALNSYENRVYRIGMEEALDLDSFGTQSYRYLLEHGFIPQHIELAYRTLAEDLLRQIEAAFRRAGDVARIRLHGDCHPGNILWTDDGPHFVDLDDCRSGPAVQDLWMLLSGDRNEMALQLSEIVAGYELFRDFDRRELHLIEALRTLRMLHYAAWIARRWDDPAFPQAFTWFNTPRYWEEHVLQLREQAAALDEPPLAV